MDNPDVRQALAKIVERAGAAPEALAAKGVPVHRKRDQDPQPTSREQIYDCLYNGFDPMLSMPENVEMFDVSLPNSYAVPTIEPDRCFHFTYKSDRCELDMTFAAVLEPHIEAETVKDDEQLHGWWSQVDVGHSDQLGRMRGSFTVDGERYDVDCYSMRDRSWGPRTLLPVRLCYPWATAADDHSFLAPSVSQTPLTRCSTPWSG